MKEQILERSDRIKMFISEYYFGYAWWMSCIIIFGGPIALAAGIYFYNSNERSGIAYGGFCFLYGIYYSLKPLFWIAFRLDAFKTVPVTIDIHDNNLTIKDAVAESVVDLRAVRILKRKKYFTFELAKFTKVYLPFRLLSPDQIARIESISGKSSE